jgi:hypothetical protein
MLYRGVDRPRDWVIVATRGDTQESLRLERCERQ